MAKTTTPGQQAQPMNKKEAKLETKPETASAKPALVCVIPGCERPRKTRGLCATCYAAAGVKVKNGSITWEKLEELGLSLPSSYGGERDLFRNALAAALEKVTPVEKGKTPELPWSREKK